MIKTHKRQVIISSIVILLPILIGLFIWNFLPDRIVTHWNFNGEADGWSGKGFTVFGLPMILFVAHWICVIFTSFDSKNKEQNRKVSSMVLWIMPVISLLMCSLTYAIALGYEINIGIGVRILFGLMFLVFGNYMPKCKQNHTIGIKVKWTLRNEENWNKTHRFAGRLWVVGGVFILATLFIPLDSFVYIFFPLVLVMAFGPMIYSYIYYKKQEKEGRVNAEDVELTPSEKKTTKISAVVGISILILAIVLLGTGNFEVTFGEEALTIDATYWDDATVGYAEIDAVEYREHDDPKAAARRTFGYGSFNLLMGEFENGEFGSYTRYTYMACDANIVLTVEDKVLVFNGKDEATTKEMYEQLLQKIDE